MNALKVTLSAFGQAHRFIWEEGFLKMLYVPLLLTVLYFPVMVGACYFSAAMVVEFFEGQLGLGGDYGGWAWVEWLAEIILFLGIGVLGIITYRSVVLLFYSFYLDKIAEKVEASVTGQVIDCNRPTTQILGRMVVVAIITVVGTVTMLLIEIGANLIPFIGGLIALALIIPCEMFLTGIGFIDPYFDRAGYSGMQSFRVMRNRFFTVGIFSSLGGLILLIPLFGWFLGPTYSVVAGIILALQFNAEHQAKKDSENLENKRPPIKRQHKTPEKTPQQTVTDQSDPPQKNLY